MIKAFIDGRDIFVSLPTGSGKSLCYFALPYTFDILRGATSSIVVIVSALMKEQVEKLRKKGAKAVYTGYKCDTEIKSGSKLDSCRIQLTTHLDS